MPYPPPEKEANKLNGSERKLVDSVSPPSEKVKTKEDKLNVSKRKLVESVIEIVKNEKLDLDQINRAHDILCSLKEIREGRNGVASSIPTVPSDYVCPITMKIMDEPVILHSRRVYDKDSILEWMRDNHRSRRNSNIILMDLRTTPNYKLTRDGSIHEWCKQLVASAIRKLSHSSLTERMKAATQILELTKDSKHARGFLRDLGGIDPLLRLLSGGGDLDPDLREELVSIFFNLSSDDSYRKLFLESFPIHLLGSCLRTGTAKSKRMAAATISLLANDGIKLELFEEAAVTPLVDLLEDEKESMVREAATALWKLCFNCKRNRNMAVSRGAIGAIRRQLSRNMVVVSELLALCIVLSFAPGIWKKPGDDKMAKILFDILKKEDTRDVTKEHCVVLLLSIWESHKRCLKSIALEEEYFRTVCQVAASGTVRAQVDAVEILQLIRSF